MNDSSAMIPSNQVIEIGIRGLPELSANMMAGGLYALIAETPSARYALLAGSLSSALKSGRTATVILPSKPELFIQRVESIGNIDAQALIQADQLHVFVTQNEFSKKIFRFGAERFAQELAQFEVQENGFLIFDQADELLSLHDISLALDQVDALRKWFSQWNLTGLLVFSRTTDEHEETINALMDSLTGIARLGGGKDGLEITFDYWQSPDGTLAAQNYQLQTLDSGLYEVSAKVMPSVQVMAGPSGSSPFITTPSMAQPTQERRQELRDEGEDTEPHFFYMNPELGTLSKRASGVWQQMDTLVGMIHATSNKRTSMSILSFHRDTPLRELAETVHTLRLNLGRKARIVVQEIDASLRYQNEALLLRLGLNLVIHREVPISRIPLLFQSLQGQIFTRDVNINFEEALANVLPTRLRGYLPALRFGREVRFILDRTETLSIPSVLIVGKPLPGMSPLDILKNVSLTRTGDLNTSDGESCALFLNACPESVMRAILDKILGGPAAAVFDSLEFFVQSDTIQSKLATLLDSTNLGQFPDYSSLLIQTSVQEEPHPYRTRASALPAPLPLTTGPVASSVELRQLASGLGVAPSHPEDRQAFNYNDHPDTPPVGTKNVGRATRSVSR